MLKDSENPAIYEMSSYLSIYNLSVVIIFSIYTQYPSAFTLSISILFLLIWEKLPSTLDLQRTKQKVSSQCTFPFPELIGNFGI